MAERGFTNYLNVKKSIEIGLKVFRFSLSFNIYLFLIEDFPIPSFNNSKLQPNRLVAV